MAARVDAAPSAGVADRPRPLASDERTLSVSELAWAAVIPCALVTVAAIVLLGPPVGHLLFASGSDPLWPPGWWETTGHAEPVKQGRYVVAALAPVLLVAAILAGSRSRRRFRPATIRAIVTSGHVLVAALVAVALIEQRSVLAGDEPATFGPGTVVAAAVLVLLAVLVLRRRAPAARLAALGRDTRARRGAALAFAICFAAAWMLKALMTDRQAGDVGGLNLAFTLNDAVAVLEGRTPLVDYHVIYAKLLIYPTAVVLATFGTTIFVYTAFMAVLNCLVLIAVYAVFRRVTRSPLWGLVLFLPFLASSDTGNLDIVGGTVSPMTLSATWPMRFGGVYLLAWLTARHLDGCRPRRPWTLFFVGGLVAINALEFGVGAVAATAVALVCARPLRSASAALELARDAALGVLGAVAVVCLTTLARAGELPHPEQLLEWPRIFTRLGWFALPLPTSGLHLAIYATFAAAIAVAAVRFARRDADVLLTSMLAWSGVFGLLAGGYFVGRPDLQKLAAMLSPWSFAIGLLTVACVRELAARGWRRPSLPQLLVLVGFALSLCLIGRMPLPQDQIARLASSLPAPTYQAAAQQFIGTRAQRDEKVAILVPMSYRISRDLGLDNVTPYGLMNAIVTRSQLQTLVETVQREHVRSIFVPVPGSRLLQEGDAAVEQVEVLVSIGFVPGHVRGGILELRRPG